MKNNIKLYWLGLIVVFSTFILTSCEKDDEEGAPSITMIRTTAEPDVALESGGLGQTIIIKGNNLGSTQKIFINEYEVPFLPTFVTPTHIVVQIPEQVPTLATASSVPNELKVVTLYGEAKHPFTTLPPPPVITSISNEFAKAGEKLVITGNYFYFLEEVVFPGDISTTQFTASADGKKLEVVVPQGVTSAGSVVVKTESGEGNSAPRYRFNDWSGMICNFDDINKFTPWGPKPVLIDPASSPTVPAIDGKYVQILDNNPILPGSWWNNDWVVPTAGLEWPNLTGPANEYALKFEMYVPAVWNSGWFEMNFGWTYYFRFKPWEINQDPNKYWDVTGERQPIVTDSWQTVVIPLNLFRLKGSAPDGDPAATYQDLKGKDIVWAFQNQDGDSGQTVEKLHICFDNIRIVKIK